VERLAVTGTASFLGGRIVRRVVETRGPEAVVAVDVAPPPAGLPGVRHCRVDLTQPASDQRLLDVFRDQGVTAVFHAAFFTTPRRDAGYVHELESIGTLNLLAASAAAGVRHVVLRSFTAVYGARGQSPSLLTEEHPLQPDPSLGWAREKYEAEQHAAAFARRYPGMTVTVLRFAPLFGPGVHTFYTSVFDRRVVPVLMGYDPLIQLLHPDDAVEAAIAALGRAPAGPLNVVPKASIGLLAALHLGGKLPVPVPHPLAGAATAMLWATGLGPAPAGFVDYARYPFQADGSRARRELGFSPRYTSREALLAYLRYRHPARAGRPAEAEA
jgi:UDP-glucose 4-epimerase